MLDKPKEGGQVFSDSDSAILAIIYELHAKGLTVNSAECLLVCSGIACFTLSDLNGKTITPYYHINKMIKRLVTLGYVSKVGTKKTTKRDCAIYSLTDAGCALVARLTSMCR